MNWNEFKENVEKWAEERGIYEHSTADAQLLKALSELGELADAVVKDDREGLKDAIGDVAVCIVNYSKLKNWKMPSFESIGMYRGLHKDEYLIPSLLATIHAVSAWGSSMQMSPSLELSLAIAGLNSIAYMHELALLDCCAAAWQEIKDRKGKMVPGGAFVKEGEK